MVVDLTPEAKSHYLTTSTVYRGTASNHFIFINPNNFNIQVYDIFTLKKIQEIAKIRPFLESVLPNSGKKVKETEPYYLDNYTLCLHIKIAKNEHSESCDGIGLQIDLKTGNILHINGESTEKKPKNEKIESNGNSHNTHATFRLFKGNSKKYPKSLSIFLDDSQS